MFHRGTQSLGVYVCSLTINVECLLWVSRALWWRKGEQQVSFGGGFVLKSLDFILNL